MSDWFGWQGENTTLHYINGKADGLWCSSTIAGKIKSIVAYLQSTADATHTCNTRGAIFASDQSLIAQTENVLHTSAQTAWFTHTFASPPSVSATTEYIIAVCSDARGGDDESMATYYDTDGLSYQYADTLDAPPAFDDPIGGTTEVGYTLSIYASYIESPGMTMTITDGITIQGNMKFG